MNAETITSFILLIIGLFITVFIGLSSIKQLRRLKKLQAVFKYTFHAIWIAYFVGLLLFFVLLLLCVDSDCGIQFNIIFIIGSVSANIGVLLLLMILLFRLYFTFKDSMYEISKATKLAFVTSYCCIVLLFISIVSLSLYSLFIWNIYISMIIYVMQLIDGVLYIGTTIAAIKIFADKLMALTDLRATSIHPDIIKDKPSDDTNGIELNEHQMKMIENATRYVSLLFLGIFSTFLLMIVGNIYRNMYSDVYSLTYFASIYIYNIYTVLNMVCLYLQYSFGKDKYMKYCKGIHLCCRFLLTRKATKSLERKYKKIMDEAHSNEIEDNAEIQPLPLVQNDED